MIEPTPKRKRGRPRKVQKPETIPAIVPPELKITLGKIAEDYGFDADALVAYASEDSLLGNDRGNPYGTSFTVEGQLIYALIRMLKPARLLEIGTYHGGGTSHMAQACERNGQGEIVTIDIWDGAGQHLESEGKARVTVVYQNADLWILTDIGEFDFIFEDGCHSEHQVHTIWGELPRILKPGGIIATHDIATGVGQYIRNGIKKGGVQLRQINTYITPPSPCGMALWKKP